MKIPINTSLALVAAVTITVTPMSMAEGNKLKKGENEFAASSSLQAETYGTAITPNLDGTDFTYEVSEAFVLPNEVMAEITTKKTEQDTQTEFADLHNMEMVTQPMTYVTPYNPGCTVLPIGQYFNWTPSSGQQACVYVDVTVEAKYEFWIGNQTVNAQADILINHDINGNLGLSYVDQTATTGTADEACIYT